MVFYVDPFEIHYICKGCYVETFREHEMKGKVATEVIEKWKVALQEVAYICGFLFKTDET